MVFLEIITYCVGRKIIPNIIIVETIANGWTPLEKIPDTIVFKIVSHESVSPEKVSYKIIREIISNRNVAFKTFPDNII